MPAVSVYSTSRLSLPTVLSVLTKSVTPFLSEESDFLSLLVSIESAVLHEPTFSCCACVTAQSSSSPDFLTPPWVPSVVSVCAS